ncbi:MAG: polysaccharide pyruvyl transferase family protein [Dehalococcoidia bacterium]|nr:polysaccharide pyruvyl transferase family protein [Dehalococcoidia bacterium]
MIEQKRGKARVGISGSYGGLNLGDEAILQAIVTELRKSLPVEITVFSRDAEDTRRRHAVENVVPVREWARTEVLPEIEKLDLYLLGGGGILYDAEARIYLREVELARQSGVPIMVYAVGVGPLRDPAIQRLVRDALWSAAAVTVRERKARRELEDIGLQRDVVVTADPAFLLEPEPIPEDTLKREQMDQGHRLVAMSVREPGVAAPGLDDLTYHGLFANAADFIIDRYDADVVFVPMERRMMDMQHSHAVISQMLFPQRAWVLRGEYTPGQVLALMGCFDFAVGMRLHFLMFAAMREVPFVALPYADKVSGLLDDFGMEMPPISLVNSGRLIAHIDRSWDERTWIKQRIQENLPVLKERAGETNRIAVRLLTAANRSIEPERLGAAGS